jgi:hypothetical protein
MSARTVEFVRSLAARFPSLAGMLADHLEDNGEVLPHLFFGDLTRYVVSLHLAAASLGEHGAPQELRDILDFLEAAYESGDEELQELISVSFLEHIPRPGEAGSDVRGMVGPALSAQLRVIG